VIARGATFAGVVLAASLAACGSSEPASTPFIDDTGTALEPLPPDPAFEAPARERCPALLAMESLPPTLDFQDQRTADIAFLQFSDDVKMAGCLVRRDPDGTFSADHPFSQSKFTAGMFDFGEAYVDLLDWHAREGRFISGYAPGDVEAVWIERADGTRVRASMANGHFVAWWHGQADPTFVVALSPGGLEVGRKAVWVDPSL
jgi:hypothetical protein